MIVRYLLIGSAAVGAHYMILAILISYSVEPLLATTSGFLAAIAVNYGGQYRWVFRSTRPHRSALPRYITITLLMLLANGAIFWFASVNLGLYYISAQIVATASVVGLNFFTNRRFTFRG